MPPGARKPSAASVFGVQGTSSSAWPPKSKLMFSDSSGRSSTSSSAGTKSVASGAAILSASFSSKLPEEHGAGFVDDLFEAFQRSTGACGQQLLSHGVADRRP